VVDAGNPETEIAQTPDSLRDILEGTSGGICIAELATRRLRYANQALCDLLGYEREELLGLTVGDLHPSADSPWVWPELPAEGGHPQEYTPNVPCLRKDGHIVHADISATVAELDGTLCNIGFFVDRRAHRGAEAALREREGELREAKQLLEAVLDAIPDVIGVQGPDHEILRYNQAGYELLGITPEETEGRRCFELLGRTRACGHCPTQLAYETRQAAQLERYVPEMGRWFDCRAYPLLDAQGRVYRVVEHLRDVTEHRRVSERLHQSEKLEAIGQLAGGVAHDFNNQLSGILGLAELLQLELADRPDCLELVSGILGSVERASNLTGQLLAFARRGKVLSVPVDLHELVQEVLALLRRSIDKRIRVRHVRAAPVAKTRGDPSQLHNALLNLALNARDAMPSGGELTFESGTVRLAAAEAWAESLNVEPGDFAYVQVTDTGVGMDEETRRHIFEPFFTTKPKGQGTGMGLAAVYGTVKNHQGTIRVTSQSGQGACFRILLPRCEETAPRSVARPTPSPSHEGNATILLVDDEEVVRRTARRILERLGYTVLTARNGAEGTECYRKQWREIDLVILDMQMPVMGGQETFTSMQAINPEVRVLLASGYSLDRDTQSLLARGARGFLQKPLRMATMVQEISKLLED
jgi:PAS domain S-box-containing protein